LHTVIGDLPLTEANDALQLDDMNISVADYSLNSSDFAPGEDFATAHFGMDEINRNVHFRQGAAWDGTAETIPTVSEQDVAMMSETTDGIMDAVAYNYTVDDTSLGDEGITMVMGHNGWENGSFKGLDDAYAANPNSQFTVTSTSGDKIYTYEFVYHNSPEHGTYNSVLTDLLEKYPNGSHLALQTCPDENSIVVKDVYLAQLTEATTSINFVDANGETISIPGTVDVRNHIFHSGIGDITLTDENKIPADFGDSIITETHNLPSEDAPITSESDVAAPTDGNDIPRRDYWRENRLSSRINTFEDVAWATSLAGLGTGGLATYLADRGRTRSTSATKEPSKDANSPETAEKKYSGKEINGRIKKETLLSEFFKTSKQRKFTEMSERDAEDAISRTEELLGQRRNIYRFQTASERRENMLARNTGYILEQIKRLLPDYTKEDLADNLEKFDIQT
jgi:hypothetical protein